MAQARLDATRQYGAASQEALHVRLADASLMVDSGDSAADVASTLDALISDTCKMDTLYAQSLCHTAYMEKARWLVQKNRIEDARDSLLQSKAVAVKAGQARWIAVVEQKLKTLDSTLLK